MSTREQVKALVIFGIRIVLGSKVCISESNMTEICLSHFDINFT